MLSEVINKNYSKLNDSDFHVLNYIVDHIEECLSFTIVQLSEKCNVSPSTISRTTQKLGFEGFAQFKYYLEKEKEENFLLKIDKTKRFKNSILINDSEATIKSFEQNNSLEKIYKLMLESDRIFAFGTGHSQNLMLKEFTRCLLNNNIFVNIIPTTTEFELIQSNICSNDLVFIVSLSGKADGIKDILHSLLVKKVPIISVTRISQNELSSLANYNLYYQVTSLNTVKNLNTSSFFTLNLVLSLLYEGLTNYIHDSDH